MNQEHKLLVERVTALEAKVAELSLYLKSALGYLSSDPQSSLTKSRIVLEKVLLAIYRSVMKKEPARPMIGDMLSDKGFTASIPRRIAARMNTIRDMCNLGPHGELVDASDAIRVMRDLVDVLDWYVVNYDGDSPQSSKCETRHSLEILPQLKDKYPNYLCPEITSVKFIQSVDRCYLEITTAEPVSDYLRDEISKRTDLAFISGGDEDDPLFRPSSSITENAHRFVSDFDLVSIINCTDLFTEDSAIRINDFWQKFGRVPESV
jgi:hypothetical protein